MVSVVSTREGRPSFTLTEWLVILVAVIGFAFDTYELLMLPLIAGIAYEFIKFASANMENPAVRAIIAPNLLLQKLTTREPDLGMIEVAIQAMERVLAAEHSDRDEIPLPNWPETARAQL